ncbi:MAG: c-type cytochrome [Myxococcota bacterium]
MAAALLLVASVGLLAAGLAGAAGSGSALRIEQGREIYARCAACHSLERDRVGPRHCGLFGRRAGSVPGFAYSDAMRESGIVWTRETLDRFLEDPLGTVPGTFMGYAGIPDPDERSRLLVYLEDAGRRAPCNQEGDRKP